jgi:aspartyl-tRNA synthetase
MDCWEHRNQNLTAWVGDFMKELPKDIMANPDGQPVILAKDPRLPLEGFASLGPEGIEPIRPHLDVSHFSRLSSYLSKGGILVPPNTPERDHWIPYIVAFQARKRHDPKIAWRGSSTRLGDLRKRLYDASTASGLSKRPNPGNMQWTWVYNFPLFKPDGADADPGQGGAAGFSSVHHPFTAPLNYDSMACLETKPLAAWGASFDLVLNGVEVGGGSRRIHSAVVQEAILRRVLKLSDERVEQFRPLLDALKWAPPHIGFAFGFDRLAALMSGTTSIRDVVAFPKTMKGEDAWAKSPSCWTAEQLAAYNLRMKE